MNIEDKIVNIEKKMIKIIDEVKSQKLMSYTYFFDQMALLRAEHGKVGELIEVACLRNSDKYSAELELHGLILTKMDELEELVRRKQWGLE